MNPKTTTQGTTGIRMSLTQLFAGGATRGGTRAGRGAAVRWRCSISMNSMTARPTNSTHPNTPRNQRSGLTVTVVAADWASAKSSNS